MNERSWILIGGVKENLFWGKAIKGKEGLPFSVSFDYNWVLHREETKQDIVGWLHTHPGMLAYPSTRDDRTMWAWVCSFGRPLLCCIEGVDGLRAWWYMDDENPPIQANVKRISNLLFGTTNSMELNNESILCTNNRPRIEE